jgi:hypothetical protein
MISELYVYCKLRHNIYSFEYDNTISTKRGLSNCYVEWFAISFSDAPEERDDLVIAFDVFSDGKSQLRIHYPSCFSQQVNDYFGVAGHEFNQFFDIEEDYIKQIQTIMKVI